MYVHQRSIQGINMKIASQIVLMFMLFATSLHCSNDKQREQTKQQSQKATIKAEEIIITAVGDIMMGTNYPNESTMPPRDAQLLKPVTDALRKGDVIFGNLEGPVWTAEEYLNPAVIPALAMYSDNLLISCKN